MQNIIHELDEGQLKVKVKQLLAFIHLFLAILYFKT